MSENFRDLVVGMSQVLGRDTLAQVIWRTGSLEKGSGKYRYIRAEILALVAALRWAGEMVGRFDSPVRLH